MTRPPIPTGDNAAAMQFLERWKPGGPWTLTAIDPEKKGPTETATFRGGPPAGALGKFLDKWNGKRNLYFTVNPTTRDMTKKPGRTDIAALDWLHIDLDPRAGEDLDQERAAILDLLGDNRPEGVPAPTAIIFSGGGFQAFWKLAEPVEIGGDLDKAEAAKLWSLGLERKFGDRADKTHNVDRIMRLSGTVNLPDANKRRKGRAVILARVETFEPERVYSLDEFEPAEPAPAPEPVAESPGAPLAGPLDLDALGLPAALVERIKAGRSGAPKRDDDSRSGWLWHALGELMRSGIDDATIFAILTNADWHIGDPCRECPNPVAEAWRQIGKARQANPPKVGGLAYEAAMIQISQQYFAAMTGGKVRFYREQSDGTLIAMDKAAFLFETAPIQFIGEKNNLRPAAPAWLNSPRRRYFPGGLKLDPAAGPDGDAYNLWRGFAVEPVEGDWSLMQDHVKTILADGDAVAAKYILDWTAWTLQNPGTPPRVAMVFRGGEGIGKGMFARALVDIFGKGRHAMQITSGVHLTGHFNAHLRNLCLLFADEAVAAGSEAEGVLKGLITEPTISIEAKGVDVVSADNHLHIIMATNKQWAVPAAHDARRFAVFNVSDSRQGNAEYFKALAGEIKGGGLAAMLFDLLGRDLDHFDPEGDRPDTEGMRQQKALSLGDADQVFYGWLESGEIGGSWIESGINPVIWSNNPGSIRGGIYQAMREAGPKLRTSSDTLLARRLREDFGAERYKSNSKRGWSIPTLTEGRAAWFTKHGYPTSWKEPKGEDQWTEINIDLRVIDGQQGGGGS